VNEIVQAEYPSIECLSDGIAYGQIFEAIHPGSINISKMTFITKLPLDCLKNLKILENALKNMKINMTVSIDKMGNGRFQDNIIFLKWLYAHAQKYGK
jgi:RP/EB family microtubule-associated protein